MKLSLHHEHIGGLLPEWEELFAADDRGTPFQSPEWIRLWWRHWGRGSRPWVLAVRDAGQLVGLAPLRIHHLLGLRVLRVNGEPGDYWDLLARPECRTATEDEVGRELRRRHREWDVLILGQLPHGSSTAGAMKGAGLQEMHRSAVPCPVITLPDSFDAYLATLPTHRRTNLRRRLRNLDEGELELRVPPVAELPAAIGRWQALRARQWAAMGRRISRAHSRARFREFLVDVTMELVPAGRAQVWEFVRREEVVGSFINFCDSRAFYQYLGGYAPEHKRLAIGKVATALGIRSSIAAGRCSYDFLRGNEPYKYWYGAIDRPSPSVVLTSGRIRSLLAGRVGAVLPRLRR